MYVVGGYNGEEIFGDVWKLNLRTLQWTRLPYDMPQPAYFHSSALQPVKHRYIRAFLKGLFTPSVCIVKSLLA